MPKTRREPPEVAKALEVLRSQRKVAGTRSKKISVRVDPGVLKAAAERFGLPETDVSAVVNASLAMAGKRDRFKEWLRNPGDPWPDDFELAI